MRFAALMLLLCSTAQATTTFTPISPAEISSAGDPASVFDVSHPGNVYGVGPGTAFYPFPPAAFDVYDIFGGVSHTYEIGAALFADNQPMGTVNVVTVQLPAPVTLTSFRMFCGDEVNAMRSMREFRLFAGTTLIANLHMLDNSGTQSYSTVFGGPRLRIDSDILNPIAASDYRLEFVQNIGPGLGSGVRINDFQAFVPEPSGAAFIVLMGFAFFRRRGER